MCRRKHFEWSLVSLDIPFRCILIAITTIKTNVLNFDHDKRAGLEFFSSSYIAQISFHVLSDRCCLGKKFQPSQQLTKTKHVFQSCIQYFKDGMLINYIQNVYTIADYRQFITNGNILRIQNSRLPSNAPSTTTKMICRGASIFFRGGPKFHPLLQIEGRYCSICPALRKAFLGAVHDVTRP